MNLTEFDNQENEPSDPVTGLPLHTELQLKLASDLETSAPVALALLDVDNFQTFNDSYGHVDGDVLLRRLANIVQLFLVGKRSSFRYGGDEIAIVFPDCSKTEAFDICEKIRAAVPLEFDSLDVPITVSIGLAEYPGDARSRKDLCKAAADALSTSKRAGRNRVVLSPTLEEREWSPIIQDGFPE